VHDTNRQQTAEPATANRGVWLPMLSSMKPAYFAIAMPPIAPTEPPTSDIT
jgi:hypothetical protein